MRFAIGQIAHETNTFSSVFTTEASFRLWEWDQGDAVLSNHRGVQDYVGGMISRAVELDIEVIPIFSAFANPSGTITRDTYEKLQTELIQGLKQVSGLDAICLALHGAGVAQDVDDLEGALLEAVRTEMGDIPVVVTLDLHGNITDKMVAHADALLGVNLYPHTDSADRGREAIDVAKQIVEGTLHPVMSLTRLPLIIPTSTTNSSPARDINRLCWKWEEQPGVVDCTFFHGFPYTDTPDVGVTVLTVTNGDPELARLASEEVARYIWAHRVAFLADTPRPSEGIQLAQAAEGKPIVINETSDNPGGGTPGDGTHLLRAMLELKLSSACFGTICDPEVAEIAHTKGVGAHIDVRLGGKTDSLHGEPLRIRAYVKSLSDGQFVQSSPMWRGKQMNLGKSARLVVEGMDIIVVSVASQVFDEQVFLLHGIDVMTYKVVGIKSSQHFRARYESIAKEIITVDSPGLTTRELTNFAYQRISHPMYPLDAHANIDQMRTFLNTYKPIKR